MKQYSCRDIRNIALCGHGGSGKTSFAEAMLYKSGATDRLGKVLDGNTVCDYDAEEIKRKASINTALCFLEWKDIKINVVDTPGLFDFAAGLYEGVRACESVVITISGKSGVTVGAHKAYECAMEQGKAKMFVVTKLDEEHADFYKVLSDLKAAFGPSVCPVVVPYVSEGKVLSYINLIEMKAYQYDSKGNATPVPMPDSQHRLDGLIAAISEAVAETDEALFDKYFSGEQFSDAELIRGLHEGIKKGAIAPVVCVSSYTLAAVDMALSSIAYLLPSPDESGTEVGVDGSGNKVEIPCSDAQPLAAYIFKTIADPFVGKLSFIKLAAGKLSADSQLINATTGAIERMGKLTVLRGKKQAEVTEAAAGDIVVVTKLTANTCDTLCDPARVVKLTPAVFPAPTFSMAVKAKAKGDEGKISQGLQRLLEEDCTLSFAINPETHEQILSGLGEQHLDVAVAKLSAKFGVDVELAVPIVPYRETIRKKVKVEGKHKKQTGGHGQYGHVWIEFEPCDSEQLVFEEHVFGGSVPRSYFPAVEKGLQDCVRHGVLAGYPVVGLKATLLDGSYHPVDSSEMAFKMAASYAYRDGLKEASPALLEPIGRLNVLVPDANTGDMMGELNKRRGRVLGMSPDRKGISLIEAEVPISEMHDFTMLVRQMTRGMGSFTLRFERYEPVPPQLEADIVAKAAKAEAE